MKNKYIFFIVFSCSLISMGMTPKKEFKSEANSRFHFTNAGLERDSIPEDECKKRVEAALEQAKINDKTKKKDANIEMAIAEAKKVWDTEMASKLKTVEDAKKTVEAELATLKNKAPAPDAGNKKQGETDKKAIEEAQTSAKAAQNAASEAQKALSQKEIELNAKSSEVKTLQKRSDDLEQDLAKIKKIAQQKGNLEAAIAEAEKKIGTSKEQMKGIQMQKDSADKKAQAAEIGKREAEGKINEANKTTEQAKIEKAEADRKTIIAIVAGLVFLLVGGAYSWYKLKLSYKQLDLKNREIEGKNSELKLNNANLMQILGEKNALEASLESTKTELAKKKREQGNIEGVIEGLKDKGKELGLILPQLDKKSYFFAETMTSAGPRKSEEGGLGEDVTGMLVREDFACFWIFDGVSDNHILKNETGEYFSSRLLAQSIAWAMQTQLSNINGEGFDLKITFEKACEMALESLQEKINKLTSTEKANLITMIRNREIPTIATTALVGLLSKQGDLKIYRIGVDKFVALPQGKLVDPKKDGSIVDRIAFALDMDKTGQLTVKATPINDHAQYFQSLNNVTTVIGATDGISNTLLNWLKAQKNLDFANPTVRKMVANNRDQTHDDKSLCIIQIKALN